MNRSYFKAVLAFLLLFFNSISGNAQPKSVIYNGETVLDITYDQISYLGAGDSVGSVRIAIQKFKSGKFDINNKNILNLGIAKDNFWVRLQFINKATSNYDLILDLENPRLNEVDIFLINKKRLVSNYKIGDKFNFFNRKIIYNQFAIPISIKANDTIEVFMFLKHKGNTLQLPLKLHSQNSFYKKTESSYLIIGITAGIFILTFFFSVFLFIKSKNRLFVFYAIYLLSILTWLFSTEGYGFQFLWPSQPEWATRFGPGFSVFNLTTFILVALEFSKPYDHSNWMRKTLYVLAGITFLWGMQAFMPYIDIGNTTLMSVFLTTSFAIYIFSLALMMVYLLYVSIKKSKLVFYYFFAVIVSIIFSLLVVARHSGWINIPISSGNFASIGVVFEIVLMTLGIANQFNQYKKDKEEMLTQYLEQQKSITQQLLNTQELERKRISREMHDDIGAGLTQIIMMSESLKNKTNNVHEKELEDIVDTSRQLVNNMSEIIWSMNPENKTLGQLLNYLRDQLNKLLEYSGINYKTELPENNTDLILTNHQLRNILLVTKEIVNNTIKHSAAKHIKIRMEVDNSILKCFIEDDGEGFDIQKSFSGSGLRNIKQRIKESGGSINVASKANIGSWFEYSFPLNSTT